MVRNDKDQGLIRHRAVDMTSGGEVEDVQAACSRGRIFNGERECQLDHFAFDGDDVEDVLPVIRKLVDGRLKVAAPLSGAAIKSSA